MNLSNEFSTAANLGVIAKKWYRALEQSFNAAGIEITVKTGLEGAASLLAPAALVAQIIKREQRQTDRALRILLLTEDALAVMDEGIWLSFAADLAGTKAVHLHCTCDEVIHSNLYDAGTTLGLKGYSLISINDARDQEWDFALWIHPAIEAGGHQSYVDLLEVLHGAGVPVYACMYNELDALIQSYGIAAKGFEFSWLDAPIAQARLSRASVNKFGFSTADLGVEGGWGAVLTKLEPASVKAQPGDWEVIKVAMGLYRLEGASAASWSFGEVIAGVAFNQYKPIGLIGNLAIDPKTGIVLSECPTTKVLNCVGHLWTDELEKMPCTNFELVPWAAKVRLSFTNQITREDKNRQETIKLLEDAYRTGLIEAGIALARGYERIGTPDATKKAKTLYTEIGTKHPMSAYYLAHECLSKKLEQEAISLLSQACMQGYMPAFTDLGCVMKELGQVQEAVRLLTMSADRGDAEAAFRLGEMLIKVGQYDDALNRLRSAWSKGHADALNAAHWLCTQMLEHKVGKSKRVQRELKDVCFAIAKRERFASQLEKESA